MAYTEDDFERLMGGLFSPEEIRYHDNQFGAFSVERTSPGREELLGHFDELLRTLIGMDDPKLMRSSQDAFLTNLAQIIDMTFGSPIRISRVASYITDLPEGERGWGVLNCEADIFGEFNGLSIGPWYDVPREADGDEDMYLRKYGLMVAVSEPRIVYDDGQSDLMEGLTRIPLNHGKPELYHVLRP